MSAGESDADRPVDDEQALCESDYSETTMTFGPGKVPIYVIVVWALTLVGLCAYFIRFGVPDLSAWGAP